MIFKMTQFDEHSHRPRKVLDFLSPVEYREIYKIANLT